MYTAFSHKDYAWYLQFLWHEATRSISPLDGMPVHCRVTLKIKFVGTHLNTWVERGTARVKCLAQEHNTMSPARAQTWTARSGDEHTNHEATPPPTQDYAQQDLMIQGWNYFLCISILD